MKPIRSAFTLLEMLIALALMGLLMVALNTVVFSMGELWGRNSDLHLFDQHVNAVSHFLQEQFNAATFPPAARANATPITPLAVTPAGGMQDNLITYELVGGSRFLNWPGRPLPEVVCSLQVRPNDGLYLLWHSRLEMNFATTPPRETKITPLVTAIGYDYYDTTLKHWTSQSTVMQDSSGNLLSPNRITLTFAYGKLTPRTVSIVVPTAQQGPPNF
jgi:prepilin-type N-terminal cleavage/methylation domain-containing protein